MPNKIMIHLSYSHMYKMKCKLNYFSGWLKQKKPKENNFAFGGSGLLLTNSGERLTIIAPSK